MKNKAWIYYNTVTTTQRKSTAINMWYSKRTWKCSPLVELTGLQAALFLLLSLHQNHNKPTYFALLTIQLTFTTLNPLKIQLTPLLNSKSPPYSSSYSRCLPLLTLSSLLSFHFFSFSKLSAASLKKNKIKSFTVSSSLRFLIAQAHPLSPPTVSESYCHISPISSLKKRSLL